MQQAGSEEGPAFLSRGVCDNTEIVVKGPFPVKEAVLYILVEKSVFLCQDSVCMGV